MAGYAGRRGAVLPLENLNEEPADAEVHDLARTVEAWRGGGPPGAASGARPDGRGRLLVTGCS